MIPGSWSFHLRYNYDLLLVQMERMEVMVVVAAMTAVPVDYAEVVVILEELVGTMVGLEENVVVLVDMVEVELVVR